MRLELKDVGATLLVAAVTVPYVGYLARGEMPLIEDPRGMSGIGVVFAAVAFRVMSRGDRFDRTGKVQAAMAIATLALGVAAFQLAETAAAEALLAVFMVAIVLVWAAKLSDHWHRKVSPTSQVRLRVR
jgi:hypothetical protein